ncbi:MAG: RHS repeat-associated core domain-containing protein [Pontiellaceae bacterium]|nr:RHS repeat-associated core domain-containing protein [Pontiellaceae bacterium]
MTWFAICEAYGTRPSGFEWGTNLDRQKANTKDEEAELGLLNEGMRYRDLETGTFLTRDPIRYADGPNIYCYVHCNPITSFDPLGLSGMGAATYGMAITPSAQEGFQQTLKAEQETWEFVGDWGHELDPSNMNGSLNNQVEAGWSMLLKDNESAMEYFGLAQIQNSGGLGWVENTYLSSITLSYTAISVAVGNKAGLTGKEMFFMGTYAATQTAVTGGTPLEMVNSGAFFLGGGSLGTKMGSYFEGATELLENTVASMAGNFMTQMQSGEDWSWPYFSEATFSGLLGGSLMQGGDIIDKTVGVMTTWISDIVVSLSEMQKQDE